MVGLGHIYALTCQDAKGTSVTLQISATKGRRRAVLGWDASALQHVVTLAVASHNTKLCQLTRSLKCLA